MKTGKTTRKSPGMKRYRLYGLTLSSDFAFVHNIPAGSGAPDVLFRSVRAPPVPDHWSRTSPAFASTGRTDNGEPLFSLYRMTEYVVIHFADLVDFYLWPGQIIAEVPDPSYDPVVEIHFLGEVLSIWLELHGLPAIHASAVVVNGGAIGFISTNKGGKSALAATMMMQGCPLLADDILPLECCDGIVMGRPGYPQMRMWPDEADFFLGRYEHLEMVHPLYTKRRVPIGDGGFGLFCDDPQPLKALYIPERQEVHDTITIEPVSPSDALMELVRNSFSAQIVEALGLQVPRMNFFASLVLKVPIRRVTYPSGFKNLSLVRDALFADFEVL
jgi:hypothetical protein